MSLLSELKRRNVIKVAVMYAIVAWLVVQVVVAIRDPLHLPDWFPTAVIVLLIIGFPFALIVAWSFERTPEGVKRTDALQDTAEGAPAETAGSARGLLEASSVEDQSIAVLPFADMSPDHDQEYFSDGISEELLNQLAKVRDLHVAGRTSSFHFKGHTGDIAEIAARLKVAHVLEGSVRKAGNRVRITAQLIKAADGYHLWSETYDRELDDIFAIQDEIAHAVTSALSVTLGVGNLGVSTHNVEAYDAYLAGHAAFYLGGREHLLQALQHLERATRLDPEFVEAWSRLAFWSLAGMNIVLSDRSEELRKRGEFAASRALRIDPNAANALYVNGRLEARRFNWSEAERLMARAVELAPNNPDVLNACSQNLSDAGRGREALEYVRRTVELEPLSMQYAMLAMTIAEFAGDLEGAERELERAKQLEGDIGAVTGPALSLALTRGERSAIDAAAPLAIEHAYFSRHKTLDHTLYASIDDPDAAARLMREFADDPEFDNPFLHVVLAVWASYFGEDELALDVIRPVLLSGSFFPRVIWRPLHRKMRQLPGFKELVRDLGLEDYWRETGHWGDHVRPVGDGDFEITG